MVVGLERGKMYYLKTICVKYEQFVDLVVDYFGAGASEAFGVVVF